jgi:hypothetical protein
MNRKYIRIVTGLSIIIIFFLSCSPKTIGYGTIVWSPDENSFQTGQNVTVISESDLADVSNFKGIWKNKRYCNYWPV